MGKYTPMMEQYLTVKKEYQDAILFFRLGDFYEMFFEDALRASKILQITLTGRDAGQEERVPMCGIPYHSADTYIAKLINEGLKVAICEQVSNPADSPGLVQREVIRIITPGTLIDDSMLDAGSNNYIAALGLFENTVGLAYADVSTGIFKVTEIGRSQKDEILDELQRLGPAELLIPERMLEQPLGCEIENRFPHTVINKVRAFESTYQNTKKVLLDHFGILSLDCFECEQLKAGTIAAGILLGYLNRLQKQTIKNLTRLQTYRMDGFMVIDGVTRKHLELVREKRDKKYTLFDVLNHTRTAMGSRLLKAIIQQPLLDRDEIENRLDAVEELKENTFLRKSLSEKLRAINDLERLAARVAFAQVSTRDLVMLRNSLEEIPPILDIIREVQSTKLVKLRESLNPLEDMVELIASAIKEDGASALTEGNIIRTGYSEEVDDLREVVSHSKQWIIDLEARERQRTGIKSLKVKFNKVFGYFIEVTNTHLVNVPENYIRKQTLVNCERFVTDELKDFETQALGAQDRLNKLEYDLFCQVRDSVSSHTAEILTNAAVISELDVIQSMAEAAAAGNYTRPEFTAPSGRIEILAGRHPVVEKSVGEENFVPNDVFLDQEDQRIILLTGPNMSGKSTYLRQVALIVLMAQVGSFVPAEKARLSLVDRVFTRIGASDDISTGRSTFMVEMSEVANILHNAGTSSLILLDEVGRGTATYDGLSLAWAIVEYLTTELGAKTLFATHYHELATLADTYPAVENFYVAAREVDDKIVFLHKVLPGKCDRSYGIQVAKLAGLPPAVVTRAEVILSQLETAGPGAGLEECCVSNQQLSFDGLSEGEGDRNDGKVLSPEVEEILSEISGLDLSNMTPLKALNFLYETQTRLKETK